MSAADARRPRGAWLLLAFSLPVMAYGGVVTGFLLARLVVSDRFLPMSLYATFAHLLWLGALILLIVCLLLRRWRAALFVLLPALAWLVVFGPRFIGERVQAADRTGVTLTAATYNIQWRNDGYAETLAIIRGMDADVVGVQEVGSQAAALLERELSDLYPYRRLDPQEWGINGQALLSKYPIREAEFFEFGANEVSFGQQRAVIEHPVYPVVVYNLHVMTPVADRLQGELRRREVQALVERVRGESGRHLLVLGDFNLTELSDDYGALDRVLTDVYDRVGYGMGLTHHLDVWRLSLIWGRLDYVFSRGGVRPLEAEVMASSGGSDHLPVWARLELFDPTASYPD